MTSISFEDIKRAALNPSLTPFTPAEVAELLRYEDDKEQFYIRYKQILKAHLEKIPKHQRRKQ